MSGFRTLEKVAVEGLIEATISSRSFRDADSIYSVSERSADGVISKFGGGCSGARRHDILVACTTLIKEVSICTKIENHTTHVRLYHKTKSLGAI